MVIDFILLVYIRKGKSNSFICHHQVQKSLSHAMVLQTAVKLSVAIQPQQPTIKRHKHIRNQSCSQRELKHRPLSVVITIILETIMHLCNMRWCY
jgi:hypothetical protein